MSDLKKQLIRLGSTNPELRPHIREILASSNIRSASLPSSLGGAVTSFLQNITVHILKKGFDGYKGQVDPSIYRLFSWYSSIDFIASSGGSLRISFKLKGSQDLSASYLEVKLVYSPPISDIRLRIDASVEETFEIIGVASMNAATISSEIHRKALSLLKKHV